MLTPEQQAHRQKLEVMLRKIMDAVGDNKEASSAALMLYQIAVKGHIDRLERDAMREHYTGGKVDPVVPAIAEVLVKEFNVPCVDGGNPEPPKGLFTKASRLLERRTGMKRSRQAITKWMDSDPDRWRQVNEISMGLFVEFGDHSEYFGD